MRKKHEEEENVPWPNVNWVYLQTFFLQFKQSMKNCQERSKEYSGIETKIIEGLSGYKFFSFLTFKFMKLINTIVITCITIIIIINKR